MLLTVVRHLSGRRSPGDMAGTFVKLAGVFIVWSVALGAVFRIFGLSAADPNDDIAQALIGWSQTALAVTAVWFAIGLVGGLFQRLGPGGGRDGLVVMLAMCAIASWWSVRGVMLLADGAPAQRALAWTPQSSWGRVVVQGDAMVVDGRVSLSMVDAMREALAQNPQIDTLEIISGGGSAAAADLAVKVIRRRSLDVVVGQYCASACIPMLLAGAKRVAAPRAIIGCHQASDALTGRSVGPSQNFRDHPPQAGSEDLRRRIIRDCDAAPPEEIFVPSLGDLVTIGAVTHVGRSVETAVPGDEFCARSPRICAVERGRM